MSQDQLRAAHHLIEQGRIADARQILETLDDPTARQWLAQLSAARRPRRGGIGLPLPVLVALGVVIGIGVLVVMLLLTPALLTRMQDRGEGVATQAAGDEALYAALVHYCTMTTGFGGEEPCLSWTEQVIAEHHAEAVACITALGVDTPEALAQVNDCLTTNGIPAPL
ncbi:MAG: hypothetical protein U0703_16540 [Anaerolineae bacterium]